jgi:N-acetylmuramoyl-L-alanine amidase
LREGCLFQGQKISTTTRTRLKTCHHTPPTKSKIVFAQSTQTFANLSENSWIYNSPQGEITFNRSGNVRGTPYICLPEIVEKLKLKMLYNPDSFRVLLFNPQRANYALFNTYSSKVTLTFAQSSASQFEKARKGMILPSKLAQSSFEVETSRRPEFVGAELCVPIEFGDRVLSPLLTGKSPLTPVFLNDPRKLDKIQVVIDAGHGGNDHGASADSYLEKDLVLLFSKDLAKQLIQYGIGTLLTRDEDIFITLSERARITNQSAAKLFLSIHMNSHATNKKLSGFEIYVLSLTKDDGQGRATVAREHQSIPTDLPEGLERAAADLRASANFEKSLSWSEYVRKSLAQNLTPSSTRSIRMGPFYVLYAAQMPALLLELGYITNEDDRNKILNPKLRQKLVQELAKSLAQRLGSLHEPPK